jgi:hypothetical protein
MRSRHAADGIALTTFPANASAQDATFLGVHVATDDGGVHDADITVDGAYSCHAASRSIHGFTCSFDYNCLAALVDANNACTAAALSPASPHAVLVKTEGYTLTQTVNLRYVPPDDLSPDPIYTVQCYVSYVNRSGDAAPPSMSCD